MNERLLVPKEVLFVHDTLAKAEFEAYLIGGCVRDLLLVKEPKDWDITTNATPEKIQALFEETFYENKFGTVGVVTNSEDPKLKVIEVTPYRIEGKYSNARHPDEVKFSSKLEDDLDRRDFTVNAMAYEPSTGELIDTHGGGKISRERVRDEFIRILESQRPMQALYVAQKLGILKYIIPELEEGMGCDQNQAHSFDVFEHLLRSLQHAADKNWPLDVRLAALLHDIGKPATRRWSDEKRDWTFHGHDVVGARTAKRILADLRFPTDTTEKVVSLVRTHMFFADPDLVTLSAVRRVIAKVGQENIKELLNLRICDRIGTGRPKEQPFRLRKYMSMVDEAMRDPVSVSMLGIDGADLIEMGEKPGPRIGWILHALLEEVLDDPKKNAEDYLKKRASEFSKFQDAKLKKLGEAGKDRRSEEDEAAIVRLRKKHHVS
ncbi:MAG: tRNA adenylyltransferase/tRNA cytidylyltransferase [Candidatus Adlerbacteria bacterium GW2011_GWC1_50_9]|uniref:tRNA adenylyltransferase/tRNA cytidylyltransferase n=1 Tax=Candidatus Adlerbacteria bacterium GW2011_GWC1_50_9 TaxID=1618608 RepID=A0A0G1ZL21_9BACT|nr:MAG: tRNA adenylyltransferase/tRNA cytidylyltransferase [Candidatus Adlerbacteria bacterium GW2011_GWC1_50_9]